MRNYIYRIGTIEDLCKTKGYHNKYLVAHAHNYNHNSYGGRLYFFKDIKKEHNKNNIEEYLFTQLASTEMNGKKVMIRFKPLEAQEKLDEEFHCQKISYYYEFSAQDEHRVIIPLKDIEICLFENCKNSTWTWNKIKCL